VDDGAVYEPGVCNIDLRGRALRRRIGLRAAAGAAALWALFIILNASPAWRLLVFVPAMWSATAFLEVSARFCVAFGALGLVDIGGLRRARSLPGDSSRGKDRRQALKITAQGAAIGAAVAALAYFTAV